MLVELNCHNFKVHKVPVCREIQGLYFYACYVRQIMDSHCCVFKCNVFLSGKESLAIQQEF